MLFDGFRVETSRWDVSVRGVSMRRSNRASLHGSGTL